MASSTLKAAGSCRKNLSHDMKMKWYICIKARSEEGSQSTQGQGCDKISGLPAKHGSTSGTSPEGVTDPEPLLCLVFTLQPQHDDISVGGDDLQLVLFFPHLLFLVNDSAAQQIHVELGVVVFGALVALEKEDGNR